MKKEAIIERLLNSFVEQDKEEMSKEIYQTVNDEKWTLADLFVRQYLNNGGDGFGMENVRDNYDFLVEHKEELIKYNMISKIGTNNSGFNLWNDYKYELY